LSKEVGWIVVGVVCAGLVAFFTVYCGITKKNQPKQVLSDSEMKLLNTHVFYQRGTSGSQDLSHKAV
jgi:hypothetical protein